MPSAGEFPPDKASPTVGHDKKLDSGKHTLSPHSTHTRIHKIVPHFRTLSSTLLQHLPLHSPTWRRSKKGGQELPGKPSGMPASVIMLCSLFTPLLHHKAHTHVHPPPPAPSRPHTPTHTHTHAHRAPYRHAHGPYGATRQSPCGLSSGTAGELPAGELRHNRGPAVSDYVSLSCRRCHHAGVYTVLAVLHT